MTTTEYPTCLPAPDRRPSRRKARPDFSFVRQGIWFCHVRFICSCRTMFNEHSCVYWAIKVHSAFYLNQIKVGTYFWTSCGVRLFFGVYVSRTLLEFTFVHFFLVSDVSDPSDFVFDIRTLSSDKVHTSSCWDHDDVSVTQYYKIYCSFSIGRNRP